MSNLKIMGPALPDMPWEERPAGSKEVMWRYSANPIIGRDALFDLEQHFQFGGRSVQEGQV